MFPLLYGARGLQVTTVDTAIRLFADTPCRLVVLQAQPGNAGSITISGTPDGTTLDTGGIVLAAGVFCPVVIAVRNLNQLSYKASNAGDKVNVLYGT